MNALQRVLLLFGGIICVLGELSLLRSIMDSYFRILFLQFVFFCEDLSVLRLLSQSCCSLVLNDGQSVLCSFYMHAVATVKYIPSILLVAGIVMFGVIIARELLLLYIQCVTFFLTDNVSVSFRLWVLVTIAVIMAQVIEMKR